MLAKLTRRTPWTYESNRTQPSSPSLKCCDIFRNVPNIRPGCTLPRLRYLHLPFSQHLSLASYQLPQWKGLIFLRTTALRRAIWINLPGLSFLMLTCAMAGLVIYARYHDCDPIMTKKVSSPDQVCALGYNTTSRQAAAVNVHKRCALWVERSVPRALASNLYSYPMRCRTAAPTTTYTQSKNNFARNAPLQACYRVMSTERLLVYAKILLNFSLHSRRRAATKPRAILCDYLFFVSIDGVSSDINLVKKRCKCLYEKDSTQQQIFRSSQSRLEDFISTLY